MEYIFWFLILFLVVSGIAIVYSSNSAKEGKLMSLRYKYISGIPELKEGEIIRISSDNEKIEIKDLQFRDKYSIPKDKVVSKSITSSNMLTEKQKSVIQRSLVGFAVGGGLGAIIGGVSGVGTKETIELVNFLTIGYKDKDDNEQEAMFALMDKDHIMYVNMFVNSWKSYMNKLKHFGLLQVLFL